jgi:hypothetical protein
MNKVDRALSGMKHSNKFEDNQRVKIIETGEEVTVNHWSYATNLGRYTYSIIEHPSTFYFESELGGTNHDL